MDTGTVVCYTGKLSSVQNCAVCVIFNSKLEKTKYFTLYNLRHRKIDILMLLHHRGTIAVFVY